MQVILGGSIEENKLFKETSKYDMASFDEAWLYILDFSYIPGYPHQYGIEDNGKAFFSLFHESKY